MQTTDPTSGLVPFKTISGIEYLNLADIIYIEAKSRNTLLYCLGIDKPVQCFLSITEVDAILPERFFFRCHRSRIINLSHRKKLCRKTREIHLAGNHVVGIAYGRLHDYIALTDPSHKKRRK